MLKINSKKKNNKFDNFSKKALSFMLTTAMVLPFFSGTISVFADGVDGNGNDVINEDYEAGLTLKPIAPAFSYRTLLDWTPETDPDAKLNRSSVKLNKDRFQGQQINDLANPDAKITSAAIINPKHDSTVSVGGSDFNVYAFDNWQYIDSLIFWSGTEEGIFAFPSPDIVDIAHTNGVPVYATLGFPWGSGHADSIQLLKDMVEDDGNGGFPFADKMIEMAVYFGFDGYFFNQETYGHNEETAIKLNEFLRYFRSESRKAGTPLNISWYDAMANSGGVSHQDAVNSKNDLFMKKFDNDNDYGVDEFFMNYNWNWGNKTQTTNSYMKELGRNPYDAYAGFELQQNSYKTSISRATLIGEDKKLQTSIALYAPNSTMGVAKNPIDFHKQENILYTGHQGDPSLVDDSQSWSGMSRYVTDKSVIKGSEFATNFNTGHGLKWFDNGSVVRNSTWNNRAVQSIMPTWRFWVKDLVGDRANIEYDFENVFNGGTSLAINGDLTKGTNNNIMLYSTELDITDSSKVELTYKSNDQVKLSLGLAFEENYKDTEQTFFELPNSNGEWITGVVDLSDVDETMIHAISVQVEAEEAASADINLGALKVIAQEGGKLAGPSNITVDETLFHSTRSAEFRASWDSVEGAEYYEVYQVNNDGVRELLGTTRNTYFYGENITRTTENAYGDNSTTIVVRSINSQLEGGQPSQAQFAWETNIDFSEEDNSVAATNVALNAEITSVSFENPAEPAKDAIDGESGSKWAASNKSSGFIDIKLSEPKTVQRWRVEHAEYGGEASNMNTVDFELQYKNGAGLWTLAKHITGNSLPVTDVLLDEPITAQEWKLKVNNAGTSPWQAVRIYEWQMFESAEFPRPANLKTNQVKAVLNGDKVNLTFSRVPEHAEIHLYDSMESEDIIHTFKAGEIEEDDKLKRGVTVEGQVDLIDFINSRGSMGHIFYTLQPEFNLESPRNSVSVKIDAPKVMTRILVKADTGEGINSTYNLVHEDGTVTESGGSSDSGSTQDLPVGKYSLRLTSMPKGYEYERAYSFEVLNNEEAQEIIIEVVAISEYTELSTIVYEAEKMDLTDYTDESVSVFKEAIKVAKEIYASEKSTRLDYADAIANLKNATEGLVEKIDIEGLEALITLAEDVNEELYTEETVENLNTAINNAKLLLVDTDSLTKEMVDEAKKELKQAYDDLILKTHVIDKSSLEATLAEAKLIEKGNYTETSFNLLQEVIDRAEELLKEDNLTQDKLDDLNLELLEAITNLEIETLKIDVLESTLAEAESIDQTLYTTESYDKLLIAKGHAEDLLNRIKNQEKMTFVETLVTQAEIDQAVVDLRNAITNLVEIESEVVDTKDLEDLIVTAESKDEKLYTETTFTNLKNAIVKAKAVIANEEELTKETIEKAMTDLQKAIEKLILKDKDTGNGTPSPGEEDTGQGTKPDGSDNGDDKPGKPSKPSKPGTGSKDDLPATGMSAYSALTATGIGLSSLGAVALFLKKKNEEK